MNDEPAKKRTAKRTNTGRVAKKAAATSADTGPKTARKPAESGPKPAKLVRKGRRPSAGARFRRAIDWKDAPAEAELLITRGARLADRLEVLGRLLDGEPDAWLKVKIAGAVATVVVDDVLREERQLSEVLRKVIMDIRKLRGDEGSEKPPEAGATDPVERIVFEMYGRKRA